MFIQPIDRILDYYYRPTVIYLQFERFCMNGRRTAIGLTVIFQLILIQNLKSTNNQK